MKYGVTLLTKDDVNELEAIRNSQAKSAITDFAILSGGAVLEDKHTNNGEGLEDRLCYYWTKTASKYKDPSVVIDKGGFPVVPSTTTSAAIRPVLVSSAIFNHENRAMGKAGIAELDYGEYPQQAASKSLNETIELEFQAGKLQKTGRVYTTNSGNDSYRQQNVEFEYNGKYYVRMIANLNVSPIVISNGESISTGDSVWVEVQPITWLLDKNSSKLPSKKALASGIPFYPKDGSWNGHFSRTPIDNFLSEYFINEIVASRSKNMTSQSAASADKSRVR